MIAARSRFSVGLDVLNATNNSGPLPDGQFFSWLGQVQAVRRFDDWWGMQLLGHSSMEMVMTVYNQLRPADSMDDVLRALSD